MYALSLDELGKEELHNGRVEGLPQSNWMQNRLSISMLRLFEMTHHNTVNLLRRHFCTKDVCRKKGGEKTGSKKEIEGLQKKMTKTDRELDS